MIMTDITADRIDGIFDILRKNGEAAYIGEPVSQLAHALQSATFAQMDDAPPSLILAALFHDIGHFTHDFPADCADDGIDSRHEEAAMAVLDGFPLVFTQPIRLHVEAKRYLCGKDSSYHDGLSAASKHSLTLQGGPMNEADIAAFEQNTYFADAVRLRGYDDAGKMIGMDTPDLDYFHAMMRDWLLD